MSNEIDYSNLPQVPEKLKAKLAGVTLENLIHDERDVWLSLRRCVIGDDAA